MDVVSSSNVSTSTEVIVMAAVVEKGSRGGIISGSVFVNGGSCGGEEAVHGIDGGGGEAINGCVVSSRGEVIGGSVNVRDGGIVKCIGNGVDVHHGSGEVIVGVSGRGITTGCTGVGGGKVGMLVVMVCA